MKVSLYWFVSVIGGFLLGWAAKEFLSVMVGDAYKAKLSAFKTWLINRWDTLRSYKDKRSQQKLRQRLKQHEDEIDKLKADWVYTEAELRIHDLGTMIFVLVSMFGVLIIGILLISAPIVVHALQAHLSASDGKTLIGLPTFAWIVWGVMFVACVRNLAKDSNHVPKRRDTRMNELQQRIANLRKLIKENPQ